MKKIIGLFLFLLIGIQISVFSQRFQATTGTKSAEEKWAVIDDTVLNRHITIGNYVNPSSGISKLWIASYDVQGNLVTSATASSTSGNTLIARDISLAPRDVSTGNQTFYVTGLTQTLVGQVLVNQVFVGRINLNGVFLWYLENPVGGQGDEKEGVSLVTAPNEDVVVVGNMKLSSSSNTIKRAKVFLARINSSGILKWSSVYGTGGDWMARKIALGVAAPGCSASPQDLPGYFIVTGEAKVTPVPNIIDGYQHLFAALYNGSGVECWKNCYAASTTTDTYGDAGYDVLYNEFSGNYNIAGAVQLGIGQPRASQHTTPYMVDLNSNGNNVAEILYLEPVSSGPLGFYPRSISRGIKSGQYVITGPDFLRNNTFIGHFSGAAFPPPKFIDFNTTTTANSKSQPFILNDAVPEDILATKLTAFHGYIASSNTYNPNLPATDFASGEGHLIRTDENLQVPDVCDTSIINYSSYVSFQKYLVTANQISIADWGTSTLTNEPYPVKQNFCKAPCDAVATINIGQINGGTVSFFGPVVFGAGNRWVFAWDFGNGAFSNLQNPVYTFASSGVYNVCLTVSVINEFGDSCSSKTCVLVTINLCTTKAQFNYKVTCKYKVTFSNISTGVAPITYNWLFDDGSTSTAKNPVFTFSKCGPHITRLIVCTPTCCDTIIKIVDVPCCTVVSEFCLVDSGTSIKLIVDSSSNLPTTKYFVYVDGVLTSWAVNTSKILTEGGHEICVKARRVMCPGDTCCATCCKTINVHPLCNLKSDFSFVFKSNQWVQFTNKTTPSGYTSNWDLGNATTTSVTNPLERYILPGNYDVCLTTTLNSTTSACSSKVCKTIFVNSDCTPAAKFKAKFCLSNPLSVEFINHSNYSYISGCFSWDFGDSSVSPVALCFVSNVTHTYASPGTYNVCLTQMISESCWSKTCYKITVSNNVCGNSCVQLPTNPGQKPRAVNVSEENVEMPMVLESSVSNNNNNKEDNTAKFNRENEMEAKQLVLFPNPASKLVSVKYEAGSNGKGTISVFNAMGSKVYDRSVSFQNGNNNFSIPIEKFSDGGYFVRIMEGGKMRSVMFNVKN